MCAFTFELYIPKGPQRWRSVHLAVVYLIPKICLLRCCCCCCTVSNSYIYVSPISVSMLPLWCRLDGQGWLRDSSERKSIILTRPALSLSLSLSLPSISVPLFFAWYVYTHYRLCVCTLCINISTLGTWLSSLSSCHWTLQSSDLYIGGKGTTTTTSAALRIGWRQGVYTCTHDNFRHSK